MARRGSRGRKGGNRELEDMRGQMETQMKEMEEKLRTASKIMVLKEREFWRQDREQLLDEKRTLERQLSIVEGENRKLRTELQKAKEERGWQEEEVSSLRNRLLPLEKKDSAALFTCNGLNREHEMAKEEKKKREQLIISLQQKQERENVRASSSGLESIEWRWRIKVTKLEELVIEKDKEISRAVKKRRARTKAHVDTLAELNDTQSALKQSRLTCAALEKKLDTLPADKEEGFMKELSEKENSFRKILTEQAREFKKELTEKKRRKEKEQLHQELSHRNIKTRLELFELCDIWQSKAQQCEKEKMELEETLLDYLPLHPPPYDPLHPPTHITRHPLPCPRSPFFNN